MLSKILGMVSSRPRFVKFPPQHTPYIREKAPQIGRELPWKWNHSSPSLVHYVILVQKSEFEKFAR